MTEHVRVLADLSGSVVGALIDDTEGQSESDPFADALRRYREEGPPDLTATWRQVPGPATGRAAEVLRHLTRDLLKGVSMPMTEVGSETSVETSIPANVRPIEGSIRDVPSLELADDGTWRPSGAAIASQDELDARTLRRSVTSARSRYPRVPRDDRMMLPPTPRRS